MSDGIFGGLLAAGVLIPVVVALVAILFAYHNTDQKLTLTQACAFGFLWLLGAIGFGVMVAVGYARESPVPVGGSEEIAQYGIWGGIVVIVSLVGLAHAMFHFDD